MRGGDRVRVKLRHAAALALMVFGRECRRMGKLLAMQYRRCRGCHRAATCESTYDKEHILGIDLGEIERLAEGKLPSLEPELN
jgi:hypothetical protein